MVRGALCDEMPAFMAPAPVAACLPHVHGPLPPSIRPCAYRSGDEGASGSALVVAYTGHLAASYLLSGWVLLLTCATLRAEIAQRPSQPDSGDDEDPAQAAAALLRQASTPKFLVCERVPPCRRWRKGPFASHSTPAHVLMGLGPAQIKQNSTLFRKYVPLDDAPASGESAPASESLAITVHAAPAASSALGQAGTGVRRERPASPPPRWVDAQTAEGAPGFSQTARGSSTEVPADGVPFEEDRGSGGGALPGPHVGEAAASSPGGEPAGARDESSGLSLALSRHPCWICHSAPGDTVFLTCGHGGVCFTCAEKCRTQTAQGRCPICRAPIAKAVRVAAVEEKDEHGHAIVRVLDD